MITETSAIDQTRDRKSQRILVVDDEPGIVFLLQTKLENAGFKVLTANSGLEALDVIKEQGLPHLAIVDIVMPDMNGIEFCKTVGEFSDLPIILLTSIKDEDVVVQAIDAFAEDYITKPFRPRELLARIRRILRRLGDFAYTFDPITLVDERLAVDFANQKVIVNGESIEISPTETKLLHILMQNAGEILSADYLQEHLWPRGAVVKGAIRINIHRLRKKIEPDHGKPVYLLTHLRQGYSFVKQLREN